MTTPAATHPSRADRIFDSVLSLLVLVLAFLLASFVARNSDVWQHLALGRLVAAGRYDFVSDPLSYATEGVRWVNHAWLTDWASYQLFRVGGGAGLVASKAALVTLAVGTGLFQLRRDRPRWLAIGFVALAVVALSPRATLQPMIVSCLLLAVLLRLVQIGGKAYRLVPVLVAAWVNLDDWYVLGPTVTTLHWVGGRIRRSDAVPNWLPLATFAACLVSPFHVHGLTLPTELSPAFWSSELARDPRVSVQFASYFAGNPFTSEHADSAAFWAYCGLVLGGTAALIVNGRRADLGKGLTWGVVVGLSVWQARLVPLCAVVAVSLIARHVQSLTPVLSWGRIGRGATCVAVVGCGVVAWGGWLHGARGRDRIVGWAVYADPSMVQAAETLSTWRADGLLPAELRVLGTTPDVSNTLAWFAGGERGYLDTRWELHARAGRVQSLAIADQLGLATTTPAADLDPLKSYRVGTVLLYDPSPRTLASVLTADGPWRIVRIDGRAIWLAAKPGRSDAPVENWPAAAQQTFNADRLAFGGDEARELRPTRFAEYRTWWLPSSAQRLDASPVASPAPTYLNLHLASKTGSPALPLLAVRAARRAIAANPDDAPAWLDLAKAYSVLGATVENGVAGGSGLLSEVRRVQQLTALTQAVTANPESEPARDGLATTLTELGYLDGALGERRRQAVLVRRRGDAERFTLLTSLVARLEDEVFDRECSFQVQTLKMSGDPLGRARVALSLGLASAAQEILLKSSPDLYGADGVRLLAGLLLGTGQAREARALLTRDELLQNPGRLGVLEIPSQTIDGKRIVYRLPAHDWYQFLLAAATGVSDARIPLDRLQQMLTGEIDGVGGFLNQVSAPLATQVLADVGLGATGAVLPRVAIVLQRDQLLRPVLQTRFLNVERADLAVLEGWCALEDGRRTAALQRFDSALADYARAADLRVAPLKGLAELYRKSIAEAAR